MTFLSGEVRNVGIEVVSKVHQDFVIENAEYSIIKPTGEIIETGIATIDDKKIVTLFAANNRGNYYCEFTYRIGSEILKAKISIIVI